MVQGIWKFLNRGRAWNVRCARTLLLVLLRKRIGTLTAFGYYSHDARAFHFKAFLSHPLCRGNRVYLKV